MIAVIAVIAIAAAAYVGWKVCQAGRELEAFVNGQGEYSDYDHSDHVR